MSRKPTLDEGLAVTSRLVAAIRRLTHDQATFLAGLHEEDLGRSLSVWVSNGCQLVPEGPDPLPVDQAPTNPEMFVGGGGTVWRGPKGGNGLEGEERQNARSLELVQIDPMRVAFESHLFPGERLVPGEQRLGRIKAEAKSRPIVLPGLNVGATLLNQPGQLTLNWFRDAHGVKAFMLPGVELRDQHGSRHLPGLHCRSNGTWAPTHCKLEGTYAVMFPFLVVRGLQAQALQV